MSAGGVRVAHVVELPPEFDVLVAAATAEGFGALARLRDAWRAGTNRFDRPGEPLFEARADGALLGVCGLNFDPFAGDPACARVRHLFVLPAARRRGVGRALVAAVRDAAESARFRRLRLRAPESADAFYVALGFTRTVGEAHATHALDLR